MPLRTSPIIHVRTGDLKLTNSLTIKEIIKQFPEREVYCSQNLGVEDFHVKDEGSFYSFIQNNKDVSAIFFMPMLDIEESTEKLADMLSKLPVLEQSYHIFVTIYSTSYLPKRFAQLLRKYRSDHAHYFKGIDGKISKYFTDAPALLDTDSVERNEKTIFGYPALDGFNNSKAIDFESVSITRH